MANTDQEYLDAAAAALLRGLDRVGLYREALKDLSPKDADELIQAADRNAARVRKLNERR